MKKLLDIACHRFNALLGLRQRSGLFFEQKVGAMDSPDLKFGVGYTFR